MIEGLKVTVKAEELRDLCIKRADHHESRAAVYEKQVAEMKRDRVEAAPFTNGDPVAALESRRETHASEGKELRFIADHLAAGEYLLGKEDLHKLGITASRY